MDGKTGGIGRSGSGGNSGGWKPADQAPAKKKPSQFSGRSATISSQQAASMPSHPPRGEAPTNLVSRNNPHFNPIALKRLLAANPPKGSSTFSSIPIKNLKDQLNEFISEGTKFGDDPLLVTFWLQECWERGLVQFQIIEDNVEIEWNHDDINDALNGRKVCKPQKYKAERFHEKHDDSGMCLNANDRDVAIKSPERDYSGISDSDSDSGISDMDTRSDASDLDADPEVTDMEATLPTEKNIKKLTFEQREKAKKLIAGSFGDRINSPITLPRSSPSEDARSSRKRSSTDVGLINPTSQPLKKRQITSSKVPSVPVPVPVPVPDPEQIIKVKRAIGYLNRYIALKNLKPNKDGYYHIDALKKLYKDLELDSGLNKLKACLTVAFRLKYIETLGHSRKFNQFDFRFTDKKIE